METIYLVKSWLQNPRISEYEVLVHSDSVKKKNPWAEYLSGIFGKEQPRQKEQHAQQQDSKTSLTHRRDRMFSAPQPSAVRGDRDQVWDEDKGGIRSKILEDFTYLIGSSDRLLKAKDSQLRNEINHHYKNGLWEGKREIKGWMMKPLPKARNMG